MRRLWIPLSLVLVTVAALALTMRIGLSQAPEPDLAVTPPPGIAGTPVTRTDGDNVQMVIPGPGVDSIDSPDSPDNLIGFSTVTPYCYQPDPSVDTCFINFRQQSLTSDTYVRVITVTIDSRVRAVYRGFFQESMYVYYDMQPGGFKVVCGAPGASGDPSLGLTHSYAVEFRDADNGWAGNFGNLKCPPYRP